MSVPTHTKALDLAYIALMAALGALTLCVFPYVLPDLGKIFLALVLVSRVKKHLAL